MLEPEKLFETTAEVCRRLNPEACRKLVDLLERAYHAGNQIFIFGNGGSGANASHFCEDLGKGTLKTPGDPKRFRVMSLTDNTPYILAWANDEGYETIFEQQLRNFGRPGDVVIGISGSGNSANVLNAVRYANDNGMITVGMTGFDGGRLRGLAQHSIHVPVDDMGIAECLHLVIAHYVIYELRSRIHENPKADAPMLDTRTVEPTAEAIS